MNLLCPRRLAGLFCALVVVASPHVMAASAESPDGTPTSLTYLQFNATSVSAPGWTFGSNNGGVMSVTSTTSPDSSGSIDAIEASYPSATSGAQYNWANFSVASLNTEDIYIEFWAKMPDAKEGCKFLKIFGQRNTAGYADTTLSADYTGGDQGGFVDVGFGDGTSAVNDFQNVIFFNGANQTEIGRSYGIATVLTPQMAFWNNWGTTWHHFRVHVKFNSGTTSANEVPDGEVYIEIDGKVQVDATGLYNRNPADAPIDYIELFGWAQTDPSPFDLWYANVRISTGGFMSDPLPMPPGGIQVQ